jgi:hypothetical protein
MLCRLSAVALLVIASPAARAGVEGTCTYEGKTLHYSDGVAARAPDPFDDTAMVPTVWFGTVAFDHGALASVPAKDLDDAITSQIFDHDSAELRLRLDAAGAVVEALQLYVPPGNNRSLSSNEVGKLTLTGKSAGNLAGQFKLDDDEDLHCDLKFDLPMAGGGAGKPAAPAAAAAPAKPSGKPLPAGGGEPGQAYMALHRAVVAGNVDTMLTLVDAEQAEQMRQARSQPDFPKTLQMIQMFEPAEVHITGGSIDGDNAELTIAGKDADGSALTGEVKLTRTAGSWHVGKVSTSSKLTN